MRAPFASIFRTLAPALALAFALALGLCAPAPALADSPYVQGLELYRQGKYQEAEKVLRAALPAPPPVPAAPAPGAPPVPPPPPAPASPEEGHVRAVLGFTLLRRNQLADAEEQFALARRAPEPEAGRGPSTRPVATLGLGWAAFARGKTSQAVELLTEALNASATANGKPALPDMLAESVPADARLGLGLVALGRGRPQEAARLLEEAAKGPDVLASPKELFLALGDARAQTGEARLAVAAWEMVPRRASRFPGDAPRDELARLKTARLLEQGGNLPKALALYDELSGGRHYQSEGLLGQARVHLAQGRAAQAAPVLKKLVVQDPAMAEPLGRRVAEDQELRPLLRDWGLAYFHRAEYMEALSKLSGYLDDVDARDYACLMGLGWSHLRVGQGLQAWQAFTEAAQVKADTAEPLAGVGAAALVLGRTDEAREILGKALAADRKNALALNTLGHLELAAGNAQKALEHFRAALSARPDYVDSRMAVAKILFDQAQYDAAAAEYFRLATQQKRSVAAWNGLGWARLRLGQHEDALKAFTEARRINPSLPAAPYGMGITLAKLNQPDKAAQRLAEAIYLNPDFAATPEVLELMRSRPEYSELFLEMGEAYARKLYPTAAAPYLEEYLRLNPNSRPGRRSLAWASFWAGQEDKAHALFQTLITVNKDDADAHLGDGLALLSRGYLDLAEPHLKDAVRLDPTNALAWRALTLLQARQGREQDAARTHASAPKSRQERLDRMSASGFAALAEGRLADAATDFRRAVALDSSLAAPRYGLAFTLMAQGEPRLAREELLAGMNLDPAYLDEQELSNFLSRHSELSALAGDLTWSQLYALNLPAARAGFERILGRDPGNLEALFGLGATAYLQADWALAESCFDKLMPRAPLTSRSWDKWSHLMDKLGWSAFHQKKSAKALHAFDWLRTYHPETGYAAPLGGMGWALFQQGKPDQAQMLFTRSLNIFPRNLTAMRGMTALKKAPETDEQDADFDDDPPPPPRKKSKKSKKQAADEDDPAPAKKKKQAQAEPAKKAKKQTEPAPEKKAKKKAAEDDPAPKKKKAA